MKYINVTIEGEKRTPGVLTYDEILDRLTFDTPDDCIGRGDKEFPAWVSSWLKNSVMERYHGDNDCVIPPGWVWLAEEDGEIDGWVLTSADFDKLIEEWI